MADAGYFIDSPVYVSDSGPLPPWPYTPEEEAELVAATIASIRDQPPAEEPNEPTA